MRFSNSAPPSTSSLESSARALKRQKSALEKTETFTWSPGTSDIPSVASTPVVSVAVPGIPPNTNGIMTLDSAPESILFVDTEFDLERVKGLLNEYRLAKTGRDILSGDAVDESLSDRNRNEYGFEFFQARDSKDPPLSYHFGCSKFYIRACYKVYYDLIIACLESGKIDFVTLVGTPGTGKSLFYLYVFRRYRLDYPNVTIVVATFNKGSEMIECWAYQSGKDPQRCYEIPIIDGAVHIYDGTPSELPRYQKMVCFSCPNYNWIDLHRKEQRHTCLWFTPWSLEELLDLNEVCELGLGEEMISDRFNFFGGSARYCLSTDDRFVEEGRERLKKRAISIDSRDKLQVCLRGEGSDALSHEIFHLHPEISDIFPFVFLRAKSFACSRVVDDLICTGLRKTLKAQHHELVEMIQDLPESWLLRGIFFERFTRFQLGKGGSFELRSLESKRSRNFLQEIPAGSFSKTGGESGNLVLAVLDNRVLLFQATVADKHPVNAYGIFKQWKSVGKLEDFVDGKTEVLLVFVIPPETKNFRKQQIRFKDFLNDDSPLSSIKGFRYSWCQDLVKQGIRCVGQLREWLACPNDDDREKFSQYLADFDLRNFSLKYKEEISRIPQYSLTALNKPDDHFNTGEGNVISWLNKKSPADKIAFLQSQLDAATAQSDA